MTIPPEILAKLIARLDAAEVQFVELGRQLEDPAVMSDMAQLRSLSVQRAAIRVMVENYRQLKMLWKQVEENKQLVAESSDPEMKELAAQEIPGLENSAAALLDQIVGELVTAEDRSIGAVILEVRAGTGGDEAALWAGDLFEMYQRYAGRQGWKMTVMELTPGDQGGLRHAIASVEGRGSEGTNVWLGLAYEAGVHCVKRVPATETQGRIHTSTATVAVLPEPEKVQIDIPESDLKIDVTTAQGPGGQNVNKVSTAVKMVHIPTGIEVRMQESKSQQQNRAKAWQLMRARVYDHYQKIEHAKRDKQRSAMIGSGERSERIRTYRAKENIAVDHRLNESFNLTPILAGELEPMVEALIAQDREGRIAAL